MSTISIVIPVYNSANYLERLNASLVNQTYKDLEIIYVNDESPDHSVSLVEDFIQKDQRIKLYNKKNGGAADTLNYGTHQASGPYLIYIDADDSLAPNACERAVAVIEQYQVDMVFWLHTREFLQEGRSERGPKYFPEAHHFKNEQEMRHLRRRMIGLLDTELSNPVATDYFNAGWGKLYRTEVIKKNRIEWTDTQIVGSSDVLFNAQLMPYVNSAYYLPEYLLHYTKDNDSSLTKTYGWSLFGKMKHLHQAIEKVIDKHYSEEHQFKKALANRRALSLINLTLSVSRYPFHKESIESMRNYLKDPNYRAALNDLALKHLPIHYKVFFQNCRKGNVILVLLLGRLMRILR